MSYGTVTVHFNTGIVGMMDHTRRTARLKQIKTVSSNNPAGLVLTGPIFYFYHFGTSEALFYRAYDYRTS